MRVHLCIHARISAHMRPYMHICVHICTDAFIYTYMHAVGIVRNIMAFVLLVIDSFWHPSMVREREVATQTEECSIVEIINKTSNEVGQVVLASCTKRFLQDTEVLTGTIDKQDHAIQSLQAALDHTQALVESTGDF